jgi:cell wall-associated NlpC family hydrolase
MRAAAFRLVLAGLVLALLPVQLTAASASPQGPGTATLPAPAQATAAAQLAVTPGAATVAVAVATLWHSLSSPRAVDAPALLKPVRIRSWLAAMTLTQRRALNGRADSQLVLGDRVRVLSVSGAWAHVVVPGQRTRIDVRGYPGWIPVRQLTSGWLPASTSSVFVTSPTTWLRRATGERSWEVSAGTRLERLSGTPSYWIVRLPDGQTAKIARSAVVTKLPTATRSAVVAYAQRFVGLSYLWAGTSGFGFDCSGFTSTAYRLHGLTIPRDSRDQARAGTAVRRSALRPGDLVFFSSGGVVHHVGLYIGAGRMLHAPHTGTKLQNSRVFAGIWAREYSGARSLIH